jgi:hypothetical protein
MTSMVRRAIVSALLLASAPAYATGWTDFELRIDPDFTIVRANALDVVLCRADGRVVLYPTDYPGIGPIIAYAVTQDHIVTHHHGRALRQAFPNDRFEEVDRLRDYFFITTKRDARVIGPLDADGLLQQPAILAAGELAWSPVRNPSIPLRVMGEILMLAPIAILVVVAVGVWRRLRTVRAHRATPHARS